MGLSSGVIIGSVDIDDTFAAQVKGRLEIVRGRCPQMPYNAVEIMVKGKFQHIKKAFGRPLGDYPRNVIEVPGLLGYSDEQAGIENGKMVFSR
jgi:hypothetical protein